MEMSPLPIPPGKLGTLYALPFPTAYVTFLYLIPTEHVAA